MISFSRSHSMSVALIIVLHPCLRYMYRENPQGIDFSEGQSTKRFLLKRTSVNLFKLFHGILAIMPYNYFLRLTANFLAMLQDILPYDTVNIITVSALSLAANPPNYKTCTYCPMCPNVTAVNYNSPHNVTSTLSYKVFSEFTESLTYLAITTCYRFWPQLICGAIRHELLQLGANFGHLAFLDSHQPVWPNAGKGVLICDNHHLAQIRRLYEQGWSYPYERHDPAIEDVVF